MSVQESSEQKSWPEGRLFAVTGATSGIGRAVTEGLIARGALVIAVGHSRANVDRLEHEITARGRVESAIEAAGDASKPQVCAGRLVAALACDLSSLDEVRELARRIEATVRAGGFRALDGLVNNAGTVAGWHTTSVDGYELQLAVNHLAPFLLARLLLPLLRDSESGRVIFTTSGSHRGGRVRWDNLQLRRGYNALRAYRQSKLASLLALYELARRIADTNVLVTAADPGLVNTAIGEKNTGGLVRWVWSRRRRHGVSPDVGAAAALHLASAAPGTIPTGTYWHGTRAIASSPASYRAEDALRMWEISSRLVGLPSDVNATA